jgi:uncharacterized membrane protein YqjE
MPENEPRPRGVLQSLRQVSDAVLALLQNRLELFGVEIQEQKERLVKVLVLAAVMVFLANMAALVLTVTIVVLAGENARGPVLIVLSIVYLLAAVAAFMALRKELRLGPPPLSDTVSEIKKDRDWLKFPE